VGDIACPAGDTSDACQQAATEALARAQNPDAVLVLGDNQYDNGALSEYTSAGAYNGTWGVFGCALCIGTSIVHPVPGNHEYGTSGAQGYFQYFGNAIANPQSTSGYYSFNIGASWHIIALNSNCSDSGCNDAVTGYTTSAQNTWLQQDLAANHSACTLAMWHHPLFSSGWTPGAPNVAPLWTELYNAHADIVLNGHDHLYERYAQQDPSGTATTGGLREFVVGTGGESLNGLGNPTTNLQASASQFGVLVLTLHADSYDWAFKNTGGATLDQGSGVPCHGSGSSNGLAAHAIGRARISRLRYPQLTFDAQPLRSSLTAVTRAGVPVAVRCSQMCDVTINASLSHGRRREQIASYYETESQIPGPYSLIHLRLPKRQLQGLNRPRLILRFTATDGAGQHRFLTKTVRLTRP
jgi:Calcineurin-like phosphoesterase